MFIFKLLVCYVSKSLCMSGCQMWISLPYKIWFSHNDPFKAQRKSVLYWFIFLKHAIFPDHIGDNYCFYRVGVGKANLALLSVPSYNQNEIYWLKMVMGKFT